MEASRRERHRSGLIAGVGTVLIVAYSLLALAQILWLNPRAAAPGLQIDQIWEDMAAAGESMHTPLVIGILTIGPLLGLFLLVAALTRSDVTPLGMVFAYLSIIAFGPLAYFAASFGPGMSLADTYGIGGADYSPWARPLYATSALAMIALVSTAVWAAVARRRTR